MGGIRISDVAIAPAWAAPEDSTCEYYRLALDLMNQTVNRSWQLFNVLIATQVAALAAVLVLVARPGESPLLLLVLGTMCAYSLAMTRLCVLLRVQSRSAVALVNRVEEGSQGRFRLVGGAGYTRHSRFRAHLLMIWATGVLTAMWALLFLSVLWR